MAEVDRIEGWTRLLRVHAAVLPRIERALVPAGLSVTWYDVLRLLDAAPGRRLTMTELGSQAVVSRERVSRVVTELENAGLVTRTRNPDDGRSSYAKVTAEGRRRLRKAEPVYLQAVEEHYSRHLTDREVTSVAKALDKVLAAEG